ncbi:sensor histidine kinase [Ekhidna sp.]|uniref:sensor histidine kinase n=1 Tax=Ekhidna sp. TaxID=2608089 RepID=UPI003512A07D
MNLIVRITIIFVLVSLVVFLIGGIISFNVMLREVNFEQRRFLIERLDGVEERLKRRPVKDSVTWTKLRIVALEDSTEESTQFSDTLVMHNQLERMEPHLRVDAIRNVDGKSYFISLYDIIIEPDDIKDGLVESLVTMYLILLGAVLIIGFLASYFILRPFNNTLTVIKSFSLTKPDQQLEFPKSTVAEFKRLNHFLTEMTNKVKSDYQSLKEFSENASHEIQTPIAIVQSKLEVLMDGDNLTEEQLEQISFTQATIKRLSHLSNALSLLTKIENREFANVSEINLSEAIENMLEEFKELIDLKSISKTVAIEKGVTIQADRVLVEMLLTNLINNAIRHNVEGGMIDIFLKDSELKISNSGPALSIPVDELFLRFKKSNQSAKSLGLGLAIVKKICDFYDYEIRYENVEDRHTIQIKF